MNYLCASSVFSVPRWWTFINGPSPQRHKEHRGYTEKLNLDHCRTKRALPSKVGLLYVALFPIMVFMNVVQTFLKAARVPVE